MPGSAELGACVQTHQGAASAPPHDAEGTCAADLRRKSGYAGVVGCAGEVNVPAAASDPALAKDSVASRGRPWLLA